MNLWAYAFFIGFLGILPPILWLLFWLKEDLHPEPKKEIVIVFLAGMFAVVVALILESTFLQINEMTKKIFAYSAFGFQVLNLVGFSLIEEVAKTGAAFATGLKSKYFDEPEDGIVYLITAALGFAALENALFISSSLKDGLSESILVSAFRFINAILLHVSTSALIGSSFAFSFYHKSRRIKEFLIAITIAVFLHALYNFFIINSVASGTSTVLNTIFIQFRATLLVLIGAVATLLLFEKAKKESIAIQSPNI